MRHLLLLALLLSACIKKGPPENPNTGTTQTTRDEKAPPPTRTEALGKDAVPIHERLNDAAELLEADQPAAARRALTMLEDIVADEPTLAAGHFNLGVAHHQLGNFDQARAAYTRAVELDPTLTDAWLYLGVAHQQQGRYDLAVSDYRTGLQADPENIELRVALVTALRNQGRLDEAIEEAKAALRINANSLPMYNNLGLAYIERGDLALAKFVYQKALNSIEGARDSAYIHANLGWTYFQAGEKSEAEYYLLEAVKLDPELVPALVYLSRIHLDNRNYGDMIPLLERAHDKQPDNYGVLLNLGIAYRGVGRYDESEAMYRAALELDPARPDPWFNLGILYGDHQKRYEDAVAALTTYVDRGGAESAKATEFIADIEKERERAQKRRAADEERARREAEREERERLLREAEEQQDAPQPEPSPWGNP